MKTCEELLKAINCCGRENKLCGECPYNELTDDTNNITCEERLMNDAGMAIYESQKTIKMLINGTSKRIEQQITIEEGYELPKPESTSDDDQEPDGGQSGTPVPTESTVDDQEPEPEVSCGGKIEAEACMAACPKACEDCVHLPICEWCNENTKEFNFEEDGDTSHCAMRMPFSMFKEHSLDETVDGMLSPNYKERFKAEYQQTKIRYEKLKAFNNKIKAAMITRCSDGIKVEMPKHDCPEDILREQQAIMGQYLHILEVRAVIEGIEL